MAEDNQEEEVGQEEEEVQQEVEEEEDTGRCAKASGSFGLPKDDDQSLRT